MTARVEITKQLKTAYKTASKNEKSVILNNFSASTGLSRVTARRYLTSTHLGDSKVSKLDFRKAKPTKYSADSKHVLAHLWRLMIFPCGKYMRQMLPSWIPQLESHGELRFGVSKYSPGVRAELLSMSGATIDRYLKKERQATSLKGLSATRSGTLLRNSITIRKAGDEVEQEPGFFELDTVAHCGPTLRGQFVRTLTATDVLTGWTHLEAVQNNAHKHILEALEKTRTKLPYDMAAIDCDNGSEFINKEVIKWASGLELFFTRSRPYKKNDQATVESKNNHFVRKYGFHYRYDTADELKVLNLLWERVCLKMNFFTPTRKPAGYATDSTGRRKRLYDSPKTPYQRVLESGILSVKQQEELQRKYEGLNPAEITRDIVRYQSMLMGKAKHKTELLTAEVLETNRQRTRRQTGGIKAVGA